MRQLVHTSAPVSHTRKVHRTKTKSDRYFLQLKLICYKINDFHWLSPETLIGIWNDIKYFLLSLFRTCLADSMMNQWLINLLQTAHQLSTRQVHSVSRQAINPPIHTTSQNTTPIELYLTFSCVTFSSLSMGSIMQIYKRSNGMIQKVIKRLMCSWFCFLI